MNCFYLNTPQLAAGSFTPVSMGGGAFLNITAWEGLFVKDSEIIISGGNGFDLPASTASECNAWTNSTDLSGNTAAGGNALLNLSLLKKNETLDIRNSNIQIRGGDGGKAADGGMDSEGKPGKGGGYGNGVVVRGNVGKGGDTSFFLNSESGISIINSLVNVNAGGGGRAGDGGDARGGGENLTGSGGHFSDNFFQPSFVKNFQKKIYISHALTIFDFVK